MSMQIQVRIERLKEVLRRTGKSRSGIYADMAAGKFPKSLRISDHCVGWRSDEIDQWIADRTSARS